MHHHPDGRDGHSPNCPRTQREGLVVTRRGFGIGGAAVLGGVLLGGAQAAEAAVSQRIDVHHHIIPPQFLKEAPPSAAFQRNWAWWTPQKSLEEMDQNGIAMSMLSFATPYHWFPGVEPGRRLARSLCGN